MEKDKTQTDLQIFYYDLLKSNYLQIATMLEKQKDIFTCYLTINKTNSTSIENCQHLLQEDITSIRLHIQMLEELTRQRIQDLQDNKKEISQQNYHTHG